MKQDDDDLIPWADDLPPRIDEGEYDAVVRSMKKVTRYRLATVETWWRLLLPDSSEKIELPSYCNLGPVAYAKIRPGSKLASWQRAMANFTRGNPRHVTLKCFREFWFRVTVRTVTRNTKGPLHARDQYSVVDDILRVCGKLSDLSADGLPPLLSTQEARSTDTQGYPQIITGLGPLRKDALNRCEHCDEPTAFSYGGHPLCCTHAKQRADEAEG